MSLKEDICVFFSTNTHLEEPPKNPIMATIFCKKKKKKNPISQKKAYRSKRRNKRKSKDSPISCQRVFSVCLQRNSEKKMNK